MNLLLGIDVGSSAVKVALLDESSGRSVATASSPSTELKISSPEPGWAEQSPEIWWEHVVRATKLALSKLESSSAEVVAIGIAYQMHGLVLIDSEGKVIRPAIIWCDSRAVDIGADAFEKIGAEQCLHTLLNSPGNFTASKLAWVKSYEPDNYEQAAYCMLPGDYIAYRLTGEVCTTATGLSEGVFWDFKNYKISDLVTSHFGFSEDMIPPIVPCIGEQGVLTEAAARELGLTKNIPISYRAGDQPNNAFSLNALHPGEVAATAGTSGVIYAVGSEAFIDEQQRVNTFLHVNSSADDLRTGVLFCLNGAGCSYSWLRRLVEGSSYEDLNTLAASVSPGADGLFWYPFGNGAERMLGNKNPGASLEGLCFSTHNKAHIARAVKEGIVFALYAGLQLLASGGIEVTKIRAGSANLFLSPLFRKILATISNVPIQLYATDGAEGAARAAGMGCRHYSSFEDAFAGLECIEELEPDQKLFGAYQEMYQAWAEKLKSYG